MHRRRRRDVKKKELGEDEKDLNKFSVGNVSSWSPGQ